MEYELIYEISKNNFPVDIVMSFIFALVFGINGIINFVDFLTPGRRIYNAVWIIIGIIVVTIMICSGIYSFSYGGSDNASWAKEYYSGNYSVVEGIVENECLDDRVQTYSVNGVAFGISTVDGNGTLYGAVEEGDTVRIYYIIDGEEDCFENWIVKLEVLK